MIPGKLTKIHGNFKEILMFWILFEGKTAISFSIVV